MDQKSKAAAFKHLHQPGNPVVLYNIWDFGSAKAVADSGARALVTGSWSVAASQGYDDGEQIPKQALYKLTETISSRIDLPLSDDFEGGYAVAPEDVAANVCELIKAGAIGLNFEDQVVGSDELHPIDLQMKRIKAICKVGLDLGIPIFINARTDHFLIEEDIEKHPALLTQAIERGQAYADSGASGFFVPGLRDLDLIAKVCAAVKIPVNVLMYDGMPSKTELASVDVARISYGPRPYLCAMAELKSSAEKILSQ